MFRISQEIALPDGEVAERFVPLATSRASRGWRAVLTSNLLI